MHHMQVVIVPLSWKFTSHLIAQNPKDCPILGIHAVTIFRLYIPTFYYILSLSIGLLTKYLSA